MHTPHPLIHSRAMHFCMSLLMLALSGLMLVQYRFPTLLPSPLPDNFLFVPGNLPLFVGILFLCAVLVNEWHGIVNVIRIEEETLEHIEHTHPYLPQLRQMVMTVILTSLIPLTISQLMARARAGTLDLLALNGGPSISVAGRVFIDTDGDGQHDASETKGVAGATVAISSVTGKGVATELTKLTSGSDGTFSYTITETPGDTQVKSFEVRVVGGGVAAGLVPTSDTTANIAALNAASNLTKTEIVTFGWREDQRLLTAYDPCLTIGEGAADLEIANLNTRDNQTLALLRRIRDANDRAVSAEITASASPLTRSEFLSLLVQTQCLPANASQQELTKKLGEDAPFIDLPLGTDSVSVLWYTARIVHGLPVGVDTPRGPIADGSNSITLKEAEAMVGHLLGRAGRDIPVTLAKIGALPVSVVASTIDRTLARWEAARLLLASAFARGKIELTAAGESEEPAGLKTEFSAFLPTLGGCLASDLRRPEQFDFLDLPPADPLYPQAARLLAVGMSYQSGETAYLVDGDRTHLRQFGDRAGFHTFGAGRSVSWIELERDLTVLACLPIRSAEEIEAERKSKATTATAEVVTVTRPGSRDSILSRVARVRLFDLPRDGSLASRIAYGSEDYATEGRQAGLSLLSYAPGIVQSRHATSDRVTSADAAEFLASVLIYNAVRDGRVSANDFVDGTQRQRLSEALVDAITDTTSASDSAVRSAGVSAPLTARAWAGILSKLFSPALSPLLSTPTAGRVWWERIMP